MSIITPEKNAKITGNTLIVSGQTRKNSKVSITLNGNSLGTVFSDDSGFFTKEVSDITQENNTLKATLLDADGGTIAVSDDVIFTKSTSTASLYGITVHPATTVAPSTQITFTVEAVSGLSEVNIIVDNAVLQAQEEGTSGKYRVQTVAPQIPGAYAVDVEGRSLTAGSVQEKNMTILTVESVAVAPQPQPQPEPQPQPQPEPEPTPVLPAPSPVPAFRNVRADTNTERITFSFSLDNPPNNLGKFKILYGTGVGMLDSEIVTHEASRILKNGIYTWYIATLPPSTYTFKVYALDTAGALISGLVSDPVTATVGVMGCTISNVGKISVHTDASKSVLSWPSVDQAKSYNIYKVDADGKYTLFQSTPNTTYTIFLSKGSVVHENFAVKAVCGDGTESKDYS